VSNSTENVFNLAGSQVCVEDLERGSTRKSLIRPLQPVRGFHPAAKRFFR
jgi:hypothetical protein